MEIRLLGPVEVTIDGRNINLGHAKQRLILAALVANAGRPVSTQALLAGIWDDDPPRTAPALIQAYVSRLRRCLRDGDPEPMMLIGSTSGSYQADFSPSQADIHQFRALAAEARESARRGDHEMAVKQLRSAQRLWRGQPLTGLPGRWAERFRAELEEEYYAQQVQRIALELKLGRCHQVIPELTSLARQHQVDERVAGLLMKALYQSGRQTAALEVYMGTNAILNQEFGVSPGEELRELHQSILRHDPALSPAELEPGLARPGEADHHLVARRLGRRTIRGNPDRKASRLGLGHLAGADHPMRACCRRQPGPRSPSRGSTRSIRGSTGTSSSRPTSTDYRRSRPVCRETSGCSPRCAPGGDGQRAAAWPDRQAAGSCPH